MNNENPVVRMETTLGNITLELDAERAPISTANFIDYVKEGFYDWTIFHRVIPDFMIQGGGMSPLMESKETRPAIKNEATNGLKNLRGTIAMARTQVVDSATSQFFINVVDNAYLDHQDSSPGGYGYAVFGKVIDGMDTVDAIQRTATGNRSGHQNVPLEPVMIIGVTIID
jgi:cyclophilin family peptidyl-prolyl cis-trans isomerase